VVSLDVDGDPFEDAAGARLDADGRARRARGIALTERPRSQCVDHGGAVGDLGHDGDGGEVQGAVGIAGDQTPAFEQSLAKVWAGAGTDPGSFGR